MIYLKKQEVQESAVEMRIPELRPDADQHGIPIGSGNTTNHCDSKENEWEMSFKI